MDEVIASVEAGPSIPTTEASSTFNNNPQANEQTLQPSHPALATSKRKFHKLLENLTKTPSQKRSLDNGLTSTDSPAKRIRLEARARLEANSTTGISVRNDLQSRLLRARLDAARTASPDDTTGEKKERPREPNYVPWSQEAFLRRVKTFTDLRLWTSKPDAVNEVAWARRGWVCAGVDTVACRGGCEQRVVVGLRPTRKDEAGEEIADSEDYGLEVDDELVRRFEDLIVQGHEEGCLWRDSGCRRDIYHLPIARPSVWQPQLRERYSTFARLAESLPPATRLISPLDTQQVAGLLPPGLLTPHPGPIRQVAEGEFPSDAGQESISVSRISHVALNFALLGWTGDQQTPGSAIASCEACFRRLGLWLYKEDTSPSTDSVEVKDGHGPPEKSEQDSGAVDELDGQMRLDLVNNHRDYCPWVNGLSQSMPGSMAGLPAYEVLRKCIENDAGFRGVGLKHATAAAYINRPETPGGEANVDASSNFPSPVPTLRSKEDVEKQDKARFARLRELSKAIGLKGLGLKAKLGRLRTADGSRPSSAGVA